MPRWSFFTNHGFVLHFIARHPSSTTREIANAVGITERAIHKIIGDLEKEGYIVKKRVGRQNVYVVNTTLPIPGLDVEGTAIGDVLAVLGGRKGKRGITSKLAKLSQ